MRTANNPFVETPFRNYTNDRRPISRTPNSQSSENTTRSASLPNTTKSHPTKKNAKGGRRMRKSRKFKLGARTWK